ncbi:MAG: right-handed parallel beta-helix repeat-containing protein [Planctomycetota bacterium]
MKPGNEPSRDFHAPLGVYVDDDYGPWTPGWQKDRFDTIQDGVNAVEEGGTVHVLAGFYSENVVIKKTLRLIGEDREQTFIDAGDTGTAIYVQADEVVISGFTIQNSGVLWPDSGILLNAGDFHRIENNRFRNNFMAVHASDSSDNVFKGNLFEENSWQGITFYPWLETCENQVIVENIFIDNDNSIMLRSASHSLISNNTFNNQTYDESLYAEDSDGLTITNNTMFKDDHVFITGGSGHVISSNSFKLYEGIEDRVRLENVTDCLIEENLFGHGEQGGIELADASNSSVLNNDFIDLSGPAIEILTSSDITVAHNKVKKMINNGIAIRVSTNITIYQNVVENIKISSGIAVFQSSHVDVIENECTGDKSGVLVHVGSSFVTVSDNRLTGHEYNGVYLFGTDHIVSGNVIMDAMRHGIELYSSDDYQADRNTIFENVIIGSTENGIHMNGSYNSIFHNDFINNTQNAFFEAGAGNVWDDGYPSGGNYWDDYTGEDLNGDGIGDKLYPIPGGGEDRYPLMVPYNT